MPFDDTDHEDNGGGHDPHDDLNGITDAMIDAAVGTASVNGACVSCAMELMCVKVIAKHIDYWSAAYAKKLRAMPHSEYADNEEKLASAVSALVSERLKTMLNEAVEIAKTKTELSYRTRNE